MTASAYVSNNLRLPRPESNAMRVAGSRAEAPLAVFVTRADGSVAVERVQRHLVDSLASVPGVTGVYGPRRMRLCMDQARPAGRVDSAQAAGIGRGGRGIIMGIVDTGFDPHHGAFLDSAGNTRVRYLRHTDEHGTREARTPAEIAAWTTDDSTNYHATHVMGIMAGAKGPYRGVAPEADIAVCTGIDEDTYIIESIQAMADYADSVGMPLVVNLSIGDPEGPHDGTDPFCRYLDSIGRRVPIVMSAGNWGETNMVSRMEYGPDRPYWQGPILQNLSWEGNDIEGETEMWGDTSSPIDLQIRVYDDEVQRWVDTIPVEWEEPEAGVRTARVSLDGPYFTGSLSMAGSVAPYNQRYVLTIGNDVHSHARYRDQPWSRYWIGLLARPADGAGGIWAYGDGENTLWASRSAEGCSSVSEEMSISSIACGHNTTSVGSMISRNVTPVWGRAEPYNWKIFKNTVSGWSSWGTLADGRRLPHFAAPGEQVVSAFSRPFIDHEGGNPQWPWIADYDGTDYWMSLRGTSMSSPYAAGVYALWLADDPSLTPEQLRQRAIDTANADYDDIADPRWGAGCIDAVAYRPSGAVDDIIAAPDSSFPVQYFDLQGRALPSRPTLPGLYIERRPGSPAHTVAIR